MSESTVVNSLLDNPIWHALSTRHSPLAHCNGMAKRYPSEIAPFAAVPEATSAAGRDLHDLTSPGDKIGILSVIPPLPQEWETAKAFDIHQYVWPANFEAPSDDEVSLLEEQHIEAMLDLTALVYPAYFRAGTARLGKYYGIVREGCICAMGGVRFSLDGHQELSAICTHPEWRGQGLAARTTLHLAHTIMREGDIPFLHTESYNGAAKALYEKLGFRLERKLPFVVMQRN